MAVPSKTTILKTTDKVFTILDFLMREKKAFSIKELSEIFSIPPSTMYRILTTLKERNYVVQDHHTKNYRISYALLAFFHALSFDSLLLSYQGHLKLKELAFEPVSPLHLPSKKNIEPITSTASSHPIISN